jgi:hypothetical protein
MQACKFWPSRIELSSDHLNRFLRLIAFCFFPLNPHSPKEKMKIDQNLQPIEHDTGRVAMQGRKPFTAEVFPGFPP